ncbi:MAG TPA: hypothetical protein VGB20_04300 [bacterium]
MDLGMVRVAFILITGLVGSAVVGLDLGWPWGFRFVISVVAAGILVLIELSLQRLAKISVRGLSAVVFGLLLGLIMAKLASDAIGLLRFDEIVLGNVRVAMTWGFCYICMVVALRGRDEFNVIIPYVRLVRHDRGEDNYIIDTSAIIDGRLMDLCKTGFIEGRLLVPRFILRELQAVADSSDPVKRSRGRRGLDILNELKALPGVDVRIQDEEFPGIAETDAKLVKLGQMLGARVVTSDYNLNKIAQVQGVNVLNVNELAQALRPVVLPGESIEVKPIKEGKEMHQAVGYLDDGTMVVVENGRTLIGQRVRGVVTSVLQTSAGRMVFLRVDVPQAGKR